jgi:hypothetical protein
VVLRHRGIQRDRARNELRGRVMLADLMRDDAEQMEGVRVVRLGLKNLPVERFRLRQAAGLVMLKGKIEGFRKRGHFVHFIMNSTAVRTLNGRNAITG